MTHQLRQATVFQLGHAAGLDLSLLPSALWSMAAMWIGLSAIGFWLLGLSAWEAVLGGSISVVIHWLSDFWHQCGHAVAARSTGFPMTGLRFWGIFSTSLWPADESPLPGRIHIRRALGGPLASLPSLTSLSGLGTPRLDNRPEQVQLAVHTGVPGSP
jgi:hypothetical protein